MHGLGKGGYEKFIQAKTKRKQGQQGVSKQAKKGVEENKVENKKIKIKRTYKNENEP